MNKIADLWEQLIIGQKSSINKFVKLIDEELAGMDHVSMFALNKHLAGYKPQKLPKGNRLPIMPINYRYGIGWSQVHKEVTLVWQTYQSNRKTDMGQRV